MSRSEQLRFAILGTGVVADFHRLAIESCSDLGARLVAVGHHNPGWFDEIGDRFGVPCTDMGGLLEREDIDAVCVCTPSGQHASQAVAAARAGKHVLVEKPMALSLEDADNMIAACEENGVRLGVALQRRAEPLFEAAYRSIRAEDLGKLTLGTVTLPYYRSESYYDGAAWRGAWQLDGGGVLMNQGIHLVDLLLWFMGDPVAVEAKARTLARDIEVEDTLTALLAFDEGALATIAATTTTSPGFPHRIELYGTNGAIQIEGESPIRWDIADLSTGGNVVVCDSKTAPASGGGSDPRQISPTGHINIIKDFANAILNDCSPKADGVQGRRSLKTVLDIYHAAGLPTNSATTAGGD